MLVIVCAKPVAVNAEIIAKAVIFLRIFITLKSIICRGSGLNFVAGVEEGDIGRSIVADFFRFEKAGYLNLGIVYGV